MIINLLIIKRCQILLYFSPDIVERLHAPWYQSRKVLKETL